MTSSYCAIEIPGIRERLYIPFPFRLTQLQWELKWPLILSLNTDLKKMVGFHASTVYFIESGSRVM
jgi:hypothetical protein